ncbi:hypothetical protein SAMN06265174_102510 [Dietzia kunjamensis subsp. schimae]|uniref:DUF779 domain-containing protein n=1 Tax=Dietzia kunjamensis subsp. schimae TaxID=498198 RepID=A0ABY1MZH1_9ACTN|nr:DUF779 domain-containing protein [Dietzia kunjamensis]MBB1014161.1 DUF779 domain-containing protein [Dietzia kunjamensis subsp. schimae]SMO59155.1 hypothetical protein SAMN06265174_102510 [Dietzia kunjamensis subsp. schimae]
MDDVCGLPSGGSVRIAARALPPEGAPADLPPRLVATEPAVELIRELVDRHGPVMFHQSGGCCDGSAPMCYPDGELRVGQRDVLVGELDLAPGVRVWISGSQFETWKHTQLVLDAIPGRGSGFSLENPTGKRFLSRARTFDTAELAALEEFPPRLGSELEE